jgi:hypothetical protein
VKDGVRRGGEYHDVTLQWTEVLAATRADYFDMGGVGEHGNRGIVARARSWLGLEAKTPRKNDFRWNYARSGARCASLTTEWPEQTRWLVSAIESAIDHIIQRCLDPDPDRRPASPLTVAAALPGGDPLAAMLAAGETPSPELVAAAGEGAGFSRLAAWSKLHTSRRTIMSPQVIINHWTWRPGWTSSSALS